MIVTVCDAPKSTEVSHVNEDIPLTADAVMVAVLDLPRLSVTVTVQDKGPVVDMVPVVALADAVVDRSEPAHEYVFIEVPVDAVADAVRVTVDTLLIGFPELSGLVTDLLTVIAGFHDEGMLMVQVAVC